MRVPPLLTCAALAVLGASPALAQPKKAPPPHKKAHAGHTAPAGSTAPAAGSTNPYDNTDSTEAAPEASASASTAAAPEPAPAETGTSTKIDDTPPPKTDQTSGPKPSPLNPEAKEFSKGPPPPGPQALDTLLADIATLRARVAALTTSLFSSKLRIYVHTDGDDAKIENFVVTLDDGTVFRGESGFMADDQKVVYEHAVAPGSHTVGIEVERHDTRNGTYRTWQVSRFAIQVPERKVLEAILDVDDDSNMGKDFPDDQDGRYDLHIRLRAKVAE